MARGKGPRRAADVLKGLLKKNPALRGGLRGKVAQCLLETIDEMVPQEAARHCFFLGYSRGSVVVGVDASVYHHELQCYFANDLRESLRKKIPEANILRLRFEIATRPGAGGTEERND